MVDQVLLAEDDPAIHAFVSRVLHHLGYEITSAYNGLDAVEALNRRHFSLMITDVVMAGLDGIELGRRAAYTAPDMPVLFMTGYGHYYDKVSEAGVHRYEVISKPFTLQALQHSIESLLPGGLPKTAPGYGSLANYQRIKTA
jgi:DNA-binding NtrC family response regulator